LAIAHDDWSRPFSRHRQWQNVATPNGAERATLAHPKVLHEPVHGRWGDAPRIRSRKWKERSLVCRAGKRCGPISATRAPHYDLGFSTNWVAPDPGRQSWDALPGPIAQDLRRTHCLICDTRQSDARLPGAARLQRVHERWVGDCGLQSGRSSPAIKARPSRLSALLPNVETRERLGGESILAQVSHSSSYGHGRETGGTTEKKREHHMEKLWRVAELHQTSKTLFSRGSPRRDHESNNTVQWIAPAISLNRKLEFPILFL
jgi:hypothetical protein